MSGDMPPVEEKSAEEKVAEAPRPPVLTIITPETTAEEIAALTAVFAAVGGGTGAPEPPRSEWANPSRAARTTPGRTFPHGKGAWRASGLPR
ncbi:MAG: acyl-CoA carboxylase subunit epsilon [Nocardioidaceae bacterium]|nr:acyl-CoA carboxylase subunit epsilon [Nocardioidaceae bacterium]